MERIGVKHLSMGSGAVRSIFNHLINISEDYQQSKLSLMIDQPFSYAEANKLFT